MVAYWAQPRTTVRRFPFASLGQNYNYDAVNRLTFVSDSEYSRTFCSDAYGNTWVTGYSTIAPAGNTMADLKAGMLNSEEQVGSILDLSVLSDQFSEILKDASPIEATEGCRMLELRWDHYVAYLVTEEVVGSSGDHFEEVYSGNLLRLYSKSQFLDYLDRNTGGHVEPLKHYN